MSISNEELEDLCSGLVADIRNSAEKVNNIAESNRRLQQRLMESVVSSSVNDGSISIAEVSKLNSRLKEPMAEVDQWSVPEPESNLGGGDEEEPYEDLLERAQTEWGELYEDDRMWKPEDITTKAQEEMPTVESSEMDHLLGGDEKQEESESLDDFMLRMDSEWGWLEEEELEEGENEQGAASPIGGNSFSFDEVVWDDDIDLP